MHPLNLSRIAFGCDEVEVLRARHAARAVNGETWIETRYRPTRHTELIGGSLFWIIRHQWVARQQILGFDEVEGHCRIRLGAEVIPVRPRPKRAHQGWRYLEGKDAPADFDASDEDLAAMPAPMASELAALGLI